MTGATSRPPSAAASASRNAVRRRVPAGGSDVMCPSFRVTGEERHSTRGPGPAAARDARGRADHGRLAVRGGARRARPVPVLQGLPQRLPGRSGHGHVQGGVPAPPLPGAAAAALRTTRWAGCRCGCGPPRRSPGRSISLAEPGQRPGSRNGSAASRGERRLPELASETFTRWWDTIPRSGDTRKAPGDTRRPSRAPETPDPHPRAEPTPLRAPSPFIAPSPPSCCGRTPSPTTSRPRSAGPPSGCSRPRG